MISTLIKLFIKNSKNVSAPSVRKAYAVLSSTVGIILNLLLCAGKITTGFFSNSIAISADGFNNLADAGTSLAALLGFKIAVYGGGSVHPFGHGRIEWIMGIFTSIAVLLMGIKLASTSLIAIANPEKPLFSVAAVAVLIISVAVKGYMYCYNKRFAQITDSEALKATAADCISDSAATLAVLLSTIVSYKTNLIIDGYCGVLVSVFIMITGVKSLWEVLGRIMGKAADQGITDAILQNVEAYPQIEALNNLMLHDYGFGYFVVSMRAEGYRENSEQIYTAIHQLSYELTKRFHCDCFIEVDYLIDDDMLSQSIKEQIESTLRDFGNEISFDNFRLIESGSYMWIVFDLVYPADMQKYEENICMSISSKLESDNPQYHTMIKGVIRREHFSLHRQQQY